MRNEGEGYAFIFSLRGGYYGESGGWISEGLIMFVRNFAAAFLNIRV